ncbi:SLAIN motif-containing protein 1-like isoform X1 [Myxocyprinus asiaticus]|uniref:SLAIN motif-containing protein 1-like isoform X1 n=1 Tax=Myxocyprinus asiaticus TaxID=70543 RepID=UPI002221D0EC|nr:SLAIN motif-containing protein 1-like isoform X1 [Myxocyprinus asiaticus]
MDGLLFNPQIMTDVNGNSKIMNAELEVKKLQELVRKLERQNEQLRTRANAANNCTSSARLLSSPSSTCLGGPAGPDSGPFYTGNYCVSPRVPTLSYSPSFGLCTSDEHYPYFHPQSVNDADVDDGTVLDELEILDLDVALPIVGESDYSWLYVSPKAKLFPHLLFSPLQWCRHVLDNPRPEVELAKRSLCYKLDQAKRWRGILSGCVSSSIPYSPVEGVSSLSSCSKPFTKPALTEQTDPSSPNQHQFLTGRNCSSLTERSPTFLYHTAQHSNSHQPHPVSPQYSIDSELSVSELEDDSIAMSYKLQDMTDVEVMARLQEENLRQEYATTAATATRRSASFSVHTGMRRGMRSEAELEEEEDYDQLSAPHSRLFRRASMQRSMSHSQNISSSKDARRSPSTPQYLNSLSYQQLHIPNLSTAEPQSYRANTDKLRRSMPNLIRAPSIPSVLSVPNVSAPTGHIATSSAPLSLLRNSQSFDSHNGLTKIQSAIPSPGQLQQRVQSVGNFSVTTRPPLKATAYVSPTIQSASPMPSSASLNCIPSSSIPLPNKPSTPSSTSRSALPRPASFVGTSGASRSKIAQPIRSLLTPPKSVSALSALRDGSWRDGCY